MDAVTNVFDDSEWQQITDCFPKSSTTGIFGDGTTEWNSSLDADLLDFDAWLDQHYIQNNSQDDPMNADQTLDQFLSPSDFLPPNSVTTTRDAGPKPQSDIIEERLPSLADLVCQLQEMQCKLEENSRKVDVMQQYLEELQSWTLQTNNLIFELIRFKDSAFSSINEPTNQDVSRTTGAVRSRLDDIRAVDGLWNEHSGWDRAKVDAWLVDQGVENLDTVTGIGAEELALIAPVSIHFAQRKLADIDTDRLTGLPFSPQSSLRLSSRPYPHKNDTVRKSRERFDRNHSLIMNIIDHQPSDDHGAIR
ncbi:MAG: hypothetical protein Q9217_002662 [Psora testacea]